MDKSDPGALMVWCIVQAYLGGVVGLVPHYHNKAGITIKRVTLSGFPVLSKNMFT